MPSTETARGRPVPATPLSYPELWDMWDASGESWVGEHVARLRERYAVQVAIP